MDLVKAARSLISGGRLRNIHLLFVGSGEPERELRQSCHIVYDAETAGPELRSPMVPARWPGNSNGFTMKGRAGHLDDCLLPIGWPRTYNHRKFAESRNARNWSSLTCCWPRANLSPKPFVNFILVGCHCSLRGGFDRLVTGRRTGRHEMSLRFYLPGSAPSAKALRFC